MVVKKVLIVDDEKPFLFTAYAKDFEVLTALHGKEMVKVLHSILHYQTFSDSLSSHPYVQVTRPLAFNEEFSNVRR